MKLAYPMLSRAFDFDETAVNSLIIESPGIFNSFLTDLCDQLDGREGEAVLSRGEKILDISGNLELITDFLTFDINQKGLLNKIISSLEKTAVDSAHYLKTNELLMELERYAAELFFTTPCQLAYTKLSISNLLKSMGITILDDFNSVPEKLLNYMSLVYEFDRSKLFVTVNMRSYFGDTVMNRFTKSVLDHGINLLMVESRDCATLDNEKRIIIDRDMCEI